MEPQRRMLEAMGVDGMSSDEEEKVADGIQYRILAPRWRSPNVTPWLRMFDTIYRYYRLEENTNDMRGALPRRRVPTTTESTSRRFVPGLPINTYDTGWLEEQLDISNVVHPTPPIKYLHDPKLAQYVLTSRRILSSLPTYFKDSPSTRTSRVAIQICTPGRDLCHRIDPAVNTHPSPTNRPL